MARSELSRFVSRYLATHPELRERVKEIGDPDELARVFESEGARAGYGFDAADVTSALAESGSGELGDDQLEAVAGGRKAGKGQQEYLIVKLEEVLITG